MLRQTQRFVVGEPAAEAHQAFKGRVHRRNLTFHSDARRLIVARYSAQAKNAAFPPSTITTLSASQGWLDISTTFVEIVIGFGLGVAIGAAMGLFFGTFQTAGVVFEPLIAATNGVPKIALAPLFLIFFGLSISSKIAIAVMSVAFLMFYNIYFGRHAISKDLDDIVRVMGGKATHRFIYVVAPALIPPFLSGLKAGGPLATLGVIAGEFVASYNGVGHALGQSAASFDAAGAFSGLLILMALTLTINIGLGFVERKLTQRLQGVH
jgi:NitT/TauT family transport system permease protein